MRLDMAPFPTLAPAMAAAMARGDTRAVLFSPTLQLQRLFISSRCGGASLAARNTACSRIALPLSKTPSVWPGFVGQPTQTRERNRHCGPRTKGEQFTLPLVRFPTTVFPGHALTFMADNTKGDFTAAVPRRLLTLAWARYDGKLAVVGPGARIGVEITVMYDQVLEGPVPTPPGMAHAVGGRRVRLLSARPGDPAKLAQLSSQESTQANSASSAPPTSDNTNESTGTTRSGECLKIQMADVEEVENEVLSTKRRERLNDNAERALSVMATGLAQRHFNLELCSLDEEVIQQRFDPRCHPLWDQLSETPSEPEELSFWLAARLPLTTALRNSILACSCPLKRMHDVTDAMRLLIQPDSTRFAHRLRLIIDTPSSDTCSSLSSDAGVRRIIGEAAPRYVAWNSEDAFPHG